MYSVINRALKVIVDLQGQTRHLKMENPPQRPTTETLYSGADFLIGFITWLNVCGLCIEHISLAEPRVIYNAGMVNLTRVYSIFCVLLHLHKVIVLTSRWQYKHFVAAQINL